MPLINIAGAGHPGDGSPLPPLASPFCCDILLYLLVNPFLGDQGLELGQGDGLSGHCASVGDGLTTEVIPYDCNITGGRRGGGTT